uniref:Uncharacterized protein n=1 Tax=Onchocerca volvulus TaxID=6282 RepID=A0A044U8T8_ONCVO
MKWLPNEPEFLERRESDLCQSMSFEKNTGNRCT